MVCRSNLPEYLHRRSRPQQQSEPPPAGLESQRSDALLRSSSSRHKDESPWQSKQRLRPDSKPVDVSSSVQPFFLAGAGSRPEIVRFARSTFLNPPLAGASCGTSVGASCRVRTTTNFGALRNSVRKLEICNGVASRATVIVISLKKSSFLRAGEMLR